MTKHCNYNLCFRHKFLQFHLIPYVCSLMLASSPIQHFYLLDWNGKKSGFWFFFSLRNGMNILICIWVFFLWWDEFVKQQKQRTDKTKRIGEQKRKKLHFNLLREFASELFIVCSLILLCYRDWITWIIITSIWIRFRFRFFFLFFFFRHYFDDVLKLFVLLFVVE